METEQKTELKSRADALRKSVEALGGRYEICYEEELWDLMSAGLVLRHKASGARIALVSNEDKNKIFYVGFRTPPTDSTGVAHIIEHTVLCGSEKFPAKDPFIELAKGSLNTFLNAMTYPDKTLYPIASCNDKDFQNLMDVYMDAVFHPNIYRKKEIFMQEGWHYEIEKPEDPLRYNGIVYSEMKGAFSSPDEVLDNVSMKTLFPDSTYGVSSGGDPDYIPELTYEAYLDFHKRYYHPSNSYLYLYGDMDMQEKLDWLDREYLGAYGLAPVDSEIALQKPSGKITECRASYSIGEKESTDDNTYLSFSATIGESGDILLSAAFSILCDVLFNVPGAPVKQALLDAGIGKDIYASYSDSIRQPVFTVTAKNAKESQKDKFLSVIMEELKKAADGALRQKSLTAAINKREFSYREADFGQFPKGLLYGINMLNSWLHDDNAAFAHLHGNRTYQMLREKIGTGYYEELIRTCLIETKNAALTVLVPEPGLVAKKEQELAAKLEEYKRSLNSGEIEALIAQTRHLKEFQETPSTKEELEAIPMLQREDLTGQAEPFVNEERQLNGIRTMFHDVYTNGIAYVRLLFDAKRIPEEYVPYLGLLSAALDKMDAGDLGYQELAEEIGIHTGGIATHVTSVAKYGDISDYKEFLVIQVKCLYDQLRPAGELISRILGQTKFDDEKRLYEIVSEQKSRMQMMLNSAGHSAAVGRAMSYFSEKAAFDDRTGGIFQYQFLEELAENFEARKREVIEKLTELSDYLFRRSGVLVSVTADEEGYAALAKEADAFFTGLREGSAPSEMVSFTPVKKNEGFQTAGQVQYVAMCGNFMKEGFSYPGALKVVTTILSYDYLWNEIRVKGGAYGCMCGFSGLNGDSYLVSYRDPNLTETIAVFEKTAEFLEKFTADEREMTKFIIGTISGMETPLTPVARGARSLRAYLSGLDYSTLVKEREEVLSAQPEDIRKTAALLRSVVAQNNLCVVGSESRLEKEKDLFYEVKPLTK